MNPRAVCPRAVPLRLQVGRGWSVGLALGIAAVACCAAATPAYAAEPVPAERGGPPPEDDTPDGPKTLLLPTQLQAGPAQRRPPPWLREHARKLDALLNDAAQDLGLLVALGSELPDTPASESGLLSTAEAQQAQVLFAELAIEDADEPTLLLRMTLARPGSSVMLTRREVTTAEDLPVRAAVMLRDLVRATQAGVGPVAPRLAPVNRELAEPAHSRGRVILATNGALYGGFLGYSLQRAARSDDPRLLYPLVAVGAGAGLGAAIIVSDEWDVGVGDAWYLAAGAWWPAVAGHLIYAGRFRGTPNGNDDEPWLFGLVGSATGLTLSTVGLLSRGMGDGGAALAHSGGALGTVVGGLAEFAIRGRSGEIPFAGMGYGAGAGWLLASATAIHFHPWASDVLAVDIGLMLGGLAGASAGSPLLFGEQTALKTRGWVAATGAGLIGGGIVGWYLATDERSPDATEPEAKPGPSSAHLGVPLPGMIGSYEPGEIFSPGVGMQWNGQLW